MGKPKRHRRVSLITAFWKSVDKRGADECWPWVGNCWTEDRGTSYGLFSIGSKRKELAHRLSLEIAVGPIGSKLALHKCDNPPCVNPNHLYPGTAADNASDAVERGRLIDIHPNRHKKSLAKYQTTPFAEYLDTHEIGIVAFAKKADVNNGAISKLLRGEPIRRKIATKILAATEGALTSVQLFGCELHEIPTYLLNRLSDEQVAAMRRDRANGVIFRELAHRYGVSMMTAHRYCSTSTHVSSPSAPAAASATATNSEPGA